MYPLRFLSTISFLPSSIRHFSTPLLRCPNQTHVIDPIPTHRRITAELYGQRIRSATTIIPKRRLPHLIVERRDISIRRSDEHELPSISQRIADTASVRAVAA